MFQTTNQLNICKEIWIAPFVFSDLANCRHWACTSVKLHQHPTSRRAQKTSIMKIFLWSVSRKCIHQSILKISETSEVAFLAAPFRCCDLGTKIPGRAYQSAPIPGAPTKHVWLMAQGTSCATQLLWVNKDAQQQIHCTVNTTSIAEFLRTLLGTGLKTLVLIDFLGWAMTQCCKSISTSESWVYDAMCIGQTSRQWMAIIPAVGNQWGPQVTHIFKNPDTQLPWQQLSPPPCTSGSLAPPLPTHRRVASPANQPRCPRPFGRSPADPRSRDTPPRGCRRSEIPWSCFDLLRDTRNHCNATRTTRA